MHAMSDYWRLKSSRTVPRKTRDCRSKSPIPRFTKGGILTPPFLKGDTGGFVVTSSPPYIPRNDKSTPHVTGALQTLQILRNTMKRVNEA